MARRKPIQRVSKLFDKMLLDWVRHGGKPVVDSDGNPVVDERGNPRRKPLSAADLEVIRKRILDRDKDCDQGHYGVGEIVAGFRNGNLPVQESRAEHDLALTH